MPFYRSPSVLATVAGVGGGLVFTALSGLYTVKPMVIDGDVIYFGFPFAWFEAGRKGLLAIGPWVYRFVWQNSVADFIIYGLLASGFVYLYLANRKRFARNNLKTKRGA
jgi:hypothetical protein